MGWEQRPHLLRSSPDGSCLHLGLSESPVHPGGIPATGLGSAVSEAVPAPQAAGGCRQVRAVLPTAQLRGQRLGSLCVQPCLGTWVPPGAA